MLSNPLIFVVCAAAMAVVSCCALLVAARVASQALRDSSSADCPQILRSLADVYRYLLTPWRRRK
ncbi:hypothetical protein [Streptomyces varsoviensis]|uniref:Uncharacterized protein n=1 Tax=Streptomyces varsoviensis TaxID=67373 RepID=A0ABR5JEI7_9ACTN|nr:hypothetical protein [Streptomyces varsoviensis]KOG91868.1 hypothetical protein ADK38_00805 [Streptomyces varsoviensis]